MAQEETVLLQPAPLIAHLDLKPGQTVGDFGAGGAAHLALEMSQKVGAQGTVILFDVQKSALSAALSLLQARGVTNGKAVWSNLEVYGGASGVADGTIDAGVITNVLHQSKTPNAILAEVGRMLKSGSRLLIVDWMTDQTTPLAPAAEVRLSPEHVAQIAQAQGFATLEQFSAGPYHWGLVLVKT
jgi:ubiquinone/menaquinone biosynthesis C-methylase UbiE